MNETHIRNVIEAALLAAGKPLQPAELVQLFDETARPQMADIQAALVALSAEYSTRGIEIKETAAGFRIQVRREMANEVSRLWPERPGKYSRALLETLALIAYRQPITRAEIEAVRGVAVNPNIIKTVIDRNWVRVVGTRDVPGRPELLGTTREFLDYFGLKNLDDLPPLAELKTLGEIKVQFDLPDPATLALAGEANGAGGANGDAVATVGGDATAAGDGGAASGADAAVADGGAAAGEGGAPAVGAAAADGEAAAGEGGTPVVGAAADGEVDAAGDGAVAGEVRGAGDAGGIDGAVAAGDGAVADEGRFAADGADGQDAANDGAAGGDAVAVEGGTAADSSDAHVGAVTVALAERAAGGSAAGEADAEQRADNEFAETMLDEHEDGVADNEHSAPLAEHAAPTESRKKRVKARASGTHDSALQEAEEFAATIDADLAAGDEDGADDSSEDDELSAAGPTSGELVAGPLSELPTEGKQGGASWRAPGHSRPREMDE